MVLSFFKIIFLTSLQLALNSINNFTLTWWKGFNQRAAESSWGSVLDMVRVEWCCQENSVGEKEPLTQWALLALAGNMIPLGCWVALLWTTQSGEGLGEDSWMYKERKAIFFFFRGSADNLILLGHNVQGKEEKDLSRKQGLDQRNLRMVSHRRILKTLEWCDQVSSEIILSAAWGMNWKKVRLRT